MNNLRFGLDIGGTKIELRAYRDNNQEVLNQRIPTPNNYLDFVKDIVDLIRTSEQKFKMTASIGLGLPGTVCHKTGAIKNSNCVFLNGRILNNRYSKRWIVMLSLPMMLTALHCQKQWMAQQQEKVWFSESFWVPDVEGD